MKSEKNIVKNGMTSTEVLVGVVVPFLLFWGGMLTPIVSDSVLIWILGLFPFYGFITLDIIFGKNKADLFLKTSVMSVLSSVLLGLLLFFLPENIAIFKNICSVGLINIVPSLAFLFICATNSFVESIKGCPIPFIPFIIDGGS
jgi:hypothetical protein